MKKVLPVFLSLVLILFIGTVYAADEYTFGLEYTGEIVVDEQKDAAVTLTGVNGPLYTNVRIKVDITGPATPKILAYDSQGTEYDIAQTGYWGPDTGFAVQGSFTNRTPIRATFTEAGQYTVKLSLIDISNNNNVITSKDITLTVQGLTVDNTVNTVVNQVENTTVENMINENLVEEIPKTGLSYEEMAFFIIIISGIVFIMYKVYKNKIES